MAATLHKVPLAFDRAKDRFFQNLTEDEKKCFSQSTSIDDIYNLAEQLQKEQGSRGSLRNMRRIEPFLSGVAQYAKVIEVFVQAKPEIMALIWGPLKLLLQLASDFTEGFEKLMDAIGKIGESLPRFRRYAVAFSYSDQIQEVISTVYEDIMDFYRHALKFFNRRAWKIIFNLTWTSFETRFGLILRNLQRHQALVDAEACAENIIQSQKAREEDLKLVEERQIDDMHRRMKDICGWLKPANTIDLREKCGRQKKDGTGNWLIENKYIKDWMSGKGKQSVWLTGKPGSGKTILSYTVLEYLELKTASTNSSGLVLYFFCSYEQSDLVCQNILCTLIYQVVSQKKDLLAYVYPEITKPLSLSTLQKLLYDLIEASISPSEFVYIIIDGLDELSQGECEMLLRVLGGLRRKPLSLASRIFVASRDLADIRAGFEKQRPPVLEISVGENNKHDLVQYIVSESWRVVDEFGYEGAVRLSLQKEIESSLCTRADGMFLWVHLVIESLLLQDTPKEIREALNNLPEELNQVYERILARIRNLDERRKRKAKKTLEWMSCAYRPLKIEELEDALSIGSHDLTLDADSRPSIRRLRCICGPIIEIFQGTVTFVHFTAKEYLLSQPSGPFINRLSSHLNISLVCIKYQCFRCFELGIPSSDALRFLLNGDLRLFNYVHSNWFEHIREFCRLNPDKKQIEILSTSLKRFFQERVVSRNPNSVTSSLRGVSETQEFDCFESELRTSLISVLDFWEGLEKQIRSLGLGEELSCWYDENNQLMVIHGARKLQDTLEELLNQKPPDPLKTEAAYNTYGKNLYFCRYPFCKDSSSEGFSNQTERRLHEERLHIKPYRCLVEGCTRGDQNFTSKALLRKHAREYHAVAPEKTSVANIEILSELPQMVEYTRARTFNEVRYSPPPPIPLRDSILHQLQPDPVHGATQHPQLPSLNSMILQGLSPNELDNPLYSVDPPYDTSYFDAFLNLPSGADDIYG